MVRAFKAVLVLPLAMVTHLFHAQLIEHRANEVPAEQLLYLPTPDRLQLVSLGYREALADLIWIRAVVFAGTKSGAGKLDWIRRYVETISHLAPRFRRPYAWGGVISIYSGRSIDHDMIRAAIDLYRDGIDQFPEDHEMLFALGMLLTRDVQSTPGFSSIERDDAAQEGRLLIRKAAAFGAPPLVRQLAATLTAEGGSDALAIQFLETQLLHAEDPDLRRMIRNKLQTMLGYERVESISNVRDEFEAAYRSQHPYLTRELFALVRERRELVLD